MATKSQKKFAWNIFQGMEKHEAYADAYPEQNEATRKSNIGKTMQSEAFQSCLEAFKLEEAESGLTEHDEEGASFEKAMERLERLAVKSEAAGEFVKAATITQKQLSHFKKDASADWDAVTERIQRGRKRCAEFYKHLVDTGVVKIIPNPENP